MASVKHIFGISLDHTSVRVGGPQQFHLDLQIDDLQAQAGRAVGLGAARLADGPRWITLADPAGHPFDLCQADGVGPVMRLLAAQAVRSGRPCTSHHLSTRIARRVTQREGLPGPSLTSNQTRPGRLQSSGQVPSSSRLARTWSTASPSLGSGAAPVKAAAERK